MLKQVTMINSSRHNLSTALCESIRYQAKSEKKCPTRPDTQGAPRGGCSLHPKSSIGILILSAEGAGLLFLFLGPSTDTFSLTYTLPAAYILFPCPPKSKLYLPRGSLKCTTQGCSGVILERLVDWDTCFSGVPATSPSDASSSSELPVSEGEAF